MADISKISLPDGNTYNIKDANATDTKVTQTEIASVASGQPKYEVLFSETNDDYTTKTEGAKKTSDLIYNNRLKILSVDGSSIPKIYRYQKFYPSEGLVDLSYTVGKMIEDYNGLFDDEIGITDVIERYVFLSSSVVVSANSTSNLYDITNFSSKRIVPLDFWAYRLNGSNFNSYWSWIGCQCEGKWIKAINSRNTQTQIDAFRIQYYITNSDI